MPQSTRLLLVALAVAIATLHTLAAQSTLGGGVAGEQTTRDGTWTPPTGPVPRLPSGRPDFNGIWDHPYVPDMSRDGRDPRTQKGAGPLPYSPAGKANLDSYNPEDGEYTAMCMPFGLTRSMNAPYPIQMMQNDKYVAFLFEQNTWFHVVPFKDAHPEDPHPTWFGHSIARWDGDTLVIETVGFNGFTRLDTRGNPHSDQLRVVQRFTHRDAGHVAYTVTIDDPEYYTRPWTNERLFTLASGDLIEYSCEENNKSLWEGRIKIWVPPSASPPRTPPAGD